MLSNQQQTKHRRKILSITNGAIKLNNFGNPDEFFSTLSGHLERIEERQTNINGRGVVEYFDFFLNDGEEYYSLSVNKRTGTSTSIIAAIEKVPNLTSSTEIKFDVYKSGNYTNVKITADGVVVKWYDEGIPTAFGEARDKFLSEAVERINAAVSPESASLSPEVAPKN